MKVSLFIPCFVDHYYPQAGIAMVNILERLGHEVEVPEGQTCCGQPAFNSGYWEEARTTASHLLDVFENCDTVVAASGSCGAMLRVFNPELFNKKGDYDRAVTLSKKVREFSDFLVSDLKVTDLGAKFPHKVTFHDGCHGLRELGIKSQPRQLLEHVEGLELVEMSEAESCCGFGGTFSVKFPHISKAMGEVKCDSIAETDAEYVVSNDLSCLMQIQGIFDKTNRPMKSLHLAEVLDHR